MEYKSEYSEMERSKINEEFKRMKGMKMCFKC